MNRFLRTLTSLDFEATIRMLLAFASPMNFKFLIGMSKELFKMDIPWRKVM